MSFYLLFFFSRIHGLKFQSISTPDGIIQLLTGPFPGRRHDAFLYLESGTERQLRDLQVFFNRQIIIYGDSAYPRSSVLAKPFARTNASADELKVNLLMSRARISVEWCFGKIDSLFAFNDFKKNIKILKNPIANYYLVSALLTNAHTCLYGSLSSQFFSVDPPSLDDYFQL